MWENPLPENCAGLFITFCTEWILTKHLETHNFAQQSQQSENYTARLPFGSTQKGKVMANKSLYERCRGILFQKIALGKLLHFAQNGSSNKHIKTYMFA